MNQNTFCKNCHRIPSECRCAPATTLTDGEILVFEDVNGNELKVDTQKWKLKKVDEE